MSGVVLRHPPRPRRGLYLGVGVALAAVGIVLLVGGVALVPPGRGAVTVGLVVAGVVWLLIGGITIVANVASSAARLAGRPYFGVAHHGVVLGPSFVLPWSEVTELRSSWESADPSRPSMALAGGGHLANAMIRSAVAGRRTLVVSVRVRDWQTAKRRAAAAGRTAEAFFDDEHAPVIVVRLHPVQWGDQSRALADQLARYGALR